MEHHFKELYGQVITPERLICEMVGLLPDHVFKQDEYKWLDPGCGPGGFSKYILDRLFLSLNKPIDRIIHENMFMVELNSYHNASIYKQFGDKCNYYNEDYLTYNPDVKFDVIIGNPPYNANKTKDIPQRRNNLTDTHWFPVWKDFVHKSLDLLKDDGYLCFVTPASWLKPDAGGIHNLLTSYKIHRMHTMGSYETYKLFDKRAQIPCTFFLLQKKPTDNIIPIYEPWKNTYTPFKLQTPDKPIPMKHISILNKIFAFTEQHGSLGGFCLPTSSISRKVKYSNDGVLGFPYRNIKSCKLVDGKPVLVHNWSNKPGSFYQPGLPKLVLAHSVFGFPHLDSSGYDGVYGRGKFVFYGSHDFLQALRTFLSLKSILYLYSATQYRMRFLDREIFGVLPDISQLPHFEYAKIDDQYVFSYFGFDDDEISLIEQTKLWKNSHLY